MNSIYNKQIIEQQGINFLANRDIGQANIGKSNVMGSSIIEGFDNMAVNNVNNRDYIMLKITEKQLQRELQTYNKLKTQMLDNTRGYLESTRGSNENRGKNVKIDGVTGYLTQTGLFKAYSSQELANNTSGKNSCPSNWESAPQLSNHFPKNFTNQLFDAIPGDTPIINGTNMKSGQSCGLEGTNVFVSTLPNTDSKYIGIYNNVSDSDMKIQKDLGQTSIKQCNSRAALRDANYFAMSNYDGTNGTCYVGNNKQPIQRSGIATSDVVMKTMATNKPNDNNNPYMLMGYDGVIHAYSGQSPYWSSSNSPISGCDPIGGGHIYIGEGSGASATYGQNCSNWGVKPNLAATGLGGQDPLSTIISHSQFSGNKSIP